jgi:hypothetical protein
MQWANGIKEKRLGFRFLFERAVNRYVYVYVYVYTRICICVCVYITFLRHRWARLSIQQTSFTVYCLPTRANKLPFFVSICTKQTEVCRFRFPFIYIHKMELYTVLWRAAYAPGDGQTSPAYSSQPVQCLYINRLLSVNKLLLSYLLLCLLPQWWPWSGCTLCIVQCTIVHSPSPSH